MFHNQSIGAWGEELVAQYYQEHGYRIVARNWRCTHGELDIVCVNENTIYIIEVKTRTSRMFGHPEDAISPAKIQRLFRCSQAFLATHSRFRTHIVTIHVAALTQEAHRLSLKIYKDVT